MTICALLALPVLVFLIQVFSAIFFAKRTNIVESQARPSIGIIMPAHDEALVIAKTINSILPQLNSGDCLLVVADNCNDDTAKIARNLGATVVERSNLEARGKGYALDFGLQQLNNNPPQVVMIIDADCIIEPGAMQKIAVACVAYERPVQALYLMESQPNPSLKARIATFAWQVKNYVRPLGFKALGLPCQLMGTGMAFLWSDINKVNLASGHIVEDMKLGIDLARLNKAPLFLPEARVTSVFPPTQEATNTQRARWEHGHLSVILSEAPSLIFEAIKQKNGQMLALACDLLVPPLAILALLLGLMLICNVFLVPFTQLRPVFAFSVFLFFAFVIAVLLAWLFYGRHIIGFKQLCFAPIYALVKIPLYIKFFFNRQVEWVRSKRD